MFQQITGKCWMTKIEHNYALAHSFLYSAFESLSIASKLVSTQSEKESIYVAMKWTEDICRIIKNKVDDMVEKFPLKKKSKKKFLTNNFSSDIVSSQ